jgi:hypothetical protein
LRIDFVLLVIKIPMALSFVLTAQWLSTAYANLFVFHGWDGPHTTKKMDATEAVAS